MTIKENVVVGIDCANGEHFYQISTKEGSMLSRGKLKNTKKEAKKLVKKIDGMASKEDVIIGMEATNTYHICLEKYFVSNGFKVVVINPLKTSAYNKIDDYGNKTDPIDAKGLCQFLIDNKHNKIKQMNQKYLKLRELCRCWQRFQRDLTRTMLSLYSRLAIINPEFKEYFTKPLCESGLVLLEKYQTPSEIAQLEVEILQKELDKIAKGFGKEDTASRIVELAKESFAVQEDIEGYIRYVHHHVEVYRFLQKKIRQIKKEIRKEAKKEYCKDEIELITSIRGVGPEIGAGILSELGDIKNFDKISSIVNFAGMISLRKQSGKTEGKSKMSKQGSPHLRQYLHQAAMGARLHTATFAAVYENKYLRIKDLDPENKRIAKAKIRGNLARRILETITVCLMKNRPFDDKIAFDAIQIDDFIRKLIAKQFKKQLQLTQ